MSDIEVSPRNPAGLAAVTTAVTLMGMGSVVAKAAEIEGPVLAFHRAWATAAIYTLVLLATRARITRAKLRAVAPGGLWFGIQLAFFFSAIQHTTVANATMILAMQPVLVMVFFSRRFGETVGRTEWILSSVAIVGVALVVFGSSASPTWSPLGDFLACGALISWTMYFVNSKKARNTVSALEYQALSLWPSALIVLPIALAFSGTVDAGAGKWWWVPAMVAIPGSGHVFINWAHPRVPLGLISQMTLLSPVVAIALAAVLLTGESVNAAQITGMLIVLGALALLVRPSPTSTPAAD